MGKQYETILDNVRVGNGELKRGFRGVSLSENGIRDEQTISIHVKVRNIRMYGAATAE